MIDVKLYENSLGQKGYAVKKTETKLDEQKYEKEVQEIREALENIKLRERKKIERKIKEGEIVYRKGKFVYKYDEEKEYDLNKNHSDNSDDDCSDSSDDSQQ